ncbi:MAG: glycosyltransferase [Clostridia bacterium]|nr:glycosyltransferase [Clostridia bacterium]
MRFSVIVPVYNVEKYLAKCLESIINQTNQDFELIVVNDGTKDNSQSIIDEYVGKYPSKIKSFIKENGGLSDARNFGVERANGEYIVFVDSDDFINERLLEKLDEEIKKYDYLDVIGYNFVDMNEKYEQITVTARPKKSNINGQEAISSLILDKQYFEPAWGFAYNLKYWKENNFKYIKGLYHEDFALTPLVILKANKVSFIDFDGYYYIITQNSITRNSDIEKEKRLAEDLLKGYDCLKEELEKANISDKNVIDLFMSYIANSAIYRLQNLSKELKKWYRLELKKRKISKYIMNDTFKRKIRKCLIRLKNRI